jgi:signal transduction histidine kinase
MARLLAADPFLVAYIAQAAELVETRSILDILYERQQELGCDFVLALDTNGRLLARTDAPDATGVDLSKRALVAGALANHEASGVWDEGGKLHEAVVVPLVKGLDLLGYLAVGFLIDDAVAHEAKSIGGTDVVVLSRRGGATTAVASTMSPQATSAVATALTRDAEFGGSAPHDSELRLDGKPWIAHVRPLRDDRDEAPLGAVVSLASLDEAMATYRQIETVLVVVGLLAMLLAFAVSYPLSRRLLEPVRRLANAAEAARRGDYEQNVVAGGDDELARLARAFRSLLADLREKRDMEVYLGDIAHDVAESGAARSAAASTAPRDAPPRGAAGERAGETAGGEPTVSLQGGPLVAGSVLGKRYEILEVLGAGGMGIVYKTRDRHVDEIVAVKLLKPEAVGDAEHLERLKSELKLARRITHANVVRTYDFDILDGQPAISMEYVHGPTLRRLLAQSGRLPYSAGLHVARQMCAGLAAAHAERVIHRDIKPENLILQQSGTAKLADFGIARPVRRTSPGQTSAGTVLGTPHYMAPEILRGQEPDPRADIYAVGVVLYEIFTGHKPFPGTTFVEVLTKHLEQPVPAPRQFWAEMPEALERVILRCLEKDRERRYQRVEDLIGDLEALRDEIAPAPVRQAPRPQRTAILIAWLVGGMALAPAAALSQAEPPVAARRWWPTADLRLRGDFVRDLPAGRADFERVRASLRLGIAAAPTPWMEFGIVGKGALGSDNNRDNPINFDNERSDSVAVDAAYVKLARGSGGSLSAGKMELPLWLTALVWDDDLRPIGVAAGYRLDVRTYDVVRLTGGWFAADHLYGDGSHFAGLQAGWLWRPGAPRNGEVLVGFLRFDALDELPARLFRTNRLRANQLASDYRLLDAQVAIRIPIGRTAAALRADVVRNLGADSDRDGLRAIAVVGDAGRARSIEVAYAYQRIERDAVLAAMNGDDWWFHSRSRGHMLRAAIGVTSRIVVRVSSFLERRDDLARDTRRLLAELHATL